MAEVTKIPVESKIPTFISWFRDSYRFSQDWRARALRSYDYVEVNQWEAKDVEKLKKEKRPALTFNKILPQVLTLSGMQRANRLDIRALPRGSSDTMSADLMSNLIEYVLTRSNGDYEQSKIFEDGIIAGAGYLELIRSFDDDLEGELLIRNIDPLQVFRDPEGRRDDLDDARFIMKAPFKDVEELVFMFTSGDEEGRVKATKIREMAARMKGQDWLTTAFVDQNLTGDIKKELGEAFYDSKTNKVRVLEVHYRTVEKLAVVVSPDGTVTPVEVGLGDETPMEAARKLADFSGGFAEQRPIKVVRIATVLGWEILQDRVSSFPSKRFSIIPYMPLWFRRHPYGWVEYQKDPQDEKNKRRSQLLHHVNSSANSGWLNHSTEGADPRQLEENGSKSGVVINYAAVIPKQIVPHQLPPGLAALEALADRDMEDMGLQGDMTGADSQSFISGRAVQAKQFGGQIKTTRFYDQMRLTRKLLAELLVTAIPKSYSVQRISSILDQEVVRSPDGRAANLIKSIDENPESFADSVDPVAALIERATKLRFDIVVEDAPATPTQRQAALQDLIQTATMFPGIVDPDMLIEQIDVKQKDAILARVREKMGQIGQEGLQAIAQQGAKDPGLIEKLDPGDAGQRATLAIEGQRGAGGI